MSSHSLYLQSVKAFSIRIGRTGRKGNTGTAYTFFTQKNSKNAEQLINILTEAKQVNHFQTNKKRKGIMKQNLILLTWFLIWLSPGCESQACWDAADGVDDGLWRRWKKVTCHQHNLKGADHGDEHLINCVETIQCSPGGVVEEEEVEGGEDLSSSKELDFDRLSVQMVTDTAISIS